MRQSIYTRPDKPFSANPHSRPLAARTEALAAPAPIVVHAGTDCFVTPATPAALMVECANIEDHHVILEPSAGTGNIVQAIIEQHPTAQISANELNHTLYEHLSQRFATHDNVATLQGDFMRYNVARFDRILMNPPYSKRQAKKHVEHALTLLNPGGVIIALVPCNLEIHGMYELEQLDENTFSGTKVRTKIIEVTTPTLKGSVITCNV